MFKESTLKTIIGIKSMVDQLPNVSYGPNAIQYLKIENYGAGKEAYDSLMSEFDKLDLSNPCEIIDLEKEIKKQKREIKILEKKHTNLTEIIGDQKDGTEGSIANQILISLKKEIEKLIERKDSLDKEILDKEKIENLKVLKQEENAAEYELNFKKKLQI